MRKQRGFSLVELLIVIAIILVIVSIAAPPFSQQKLLASETAVLSEMQTFYVAQMQFHAQTGRYASTLAELGPPPGAGLISRVLADGSHNGYKYSLTGSESGFVLSAVPVTFGSTGRRTFYMDQTRTIHQNMSAEPATAQSPELR